MHTATRLALPVIDRVRARESRRAPRRLRALRAAERRAAARARRVATSSAGSSRRSWSTQRRAAHGVRRAAWPDAAPEPRVVPRVAVPRARSRRAAAADAVRDAAGAATERRIVGYTEASRGCKHRCRHCPIVPVYDGRFRVVPVDVVHGRRAGAGRGRRAAHHVRRSGFLQRHRPRARGRRAVRRASSRA